MPFRLWHFTWTENVASIQANGFRDGELGVVYFAPSSDPAWELLGKVLLEVTTDLAEEDLARYSNVSIDDEDPASIYRQVIYKIPAEVMNAHTTGMRLVPPDEYRPPAIPP